MNPNRSWGGRTAYRYMAFIEAAPVRPPRDAGFAKVNARTP